MPAYAENPAVSLNGKTVPMTEAGVLQDGYLYLTRAWQDGDTVEFSFDMPVRRVYCNPRVRADEGCTALQRGPLVYCFEGVDNGELIQELRIPRGAALHTSIMPDGPLAGMTVIDLTGERASFPADKEEEPLYAFEPPVHSAVPMRAVPYFAWGNRGLTQMRVWMPES